MSYEVVLQPSAERGYDELPARAQRVVLSRVQALAAQPRPRGLQPLKGLPKGNYRVRAGDYRIAYCVDDTARTVPVWQIGHRGKFYDKATRRRH